MRAILDLSNSPPPRISSSRQCESFASTTRRNAERFTDEIEGRESSARADPFPATRMLRIYRDANDDDGFANNSRRTRTVSGG